MLSTVVESSKWKIYESEIYGINQLVRGRKTEIKLKLENSNYFEKNWIKNKFNGKKLKLNSTKKLQLFRGKALRCCNVLAGNGDREAYITDESSTNSALHGKRKAFVASLLSALEIKNFSRKVFLAKFDFR